MNENKTKEGKKEASEIEQEQENSEKKLKEILNKIRKTRTYDAKEIRDVLEDNGIMSKEHPEHIEIKVSKDAKRDIFQLMDYIRRDFCYAEYIYIDLFEEVDYLKS